MNHIIIAGELKALELIIKTDARPSIGGGIALLTLGEDVGLPIGETLALADLLAKEIGIQLLKTEVLNAK